MARASARDKQPETGPEADGKAKATGTAKARGGKTQADGRAVATPWGAARLVDEVRLQQQAGDRRFSSLVQLLEGSGGERLVRFAYATDGTARRGPVTLRRRDLQRLHAALAQHPALKEALDP
jgi:hypothetical protein